MFKKLLMALDWMFFATNPYAGIETPNQRNTRTMARIIEADGQYTLNFGGNVVATYSRARDARRGAARRGLVVA